jgi:hypothetical protein
VEIKQIIRPTFRNSSGKVLFWAKVGSGKLELAPGKYAVVVESTKVIPQMVEALVERVSAGEFDSQLAKKRETKTKAEKAKPLNTPVKLAGKKKAA